MLTAVHVLQRLLEAHTVLLLLLLLSVQDANITGNKVAGLVVDGSADVTLTDSQFRKNNRAKHGGSALIAGGTSALRVARTIFKDNLHGADTDFGGKNQQLLHNHGCRW
jgi:hypothetical protein